MAERYKCIKLLGEGSFGKCYLVESYSDRSLSVIKQIDIRSLNQQEKEETLREAKILKALDHPNIIRFKDAYTSKRGKLCIVMDYADGGDLQTKIKEQKGALFSENQILDWFVQICLAIKHVHDKRILHRDLKSQNIFMMRSSRIKLGDFGIARVLSSTKDNAKTMVGTPYYLSPEIIENKPYSFKSDIWALGVLLYEMCTLRPPFDASSLHFLALKIVRGVYPALPAKYSSELKILVESMLSINPEKRPTIGNILKNPIIRSRISSYLTESLQKRELADLYSTTRLINGIEKTRRKHRQPRVRSVLERINSEEEKTSKPSTPKLAEIPSPEEAKIQPVVQKSASSEDNALNPEDQARIEEERKTTLEEIRRQKKALRRSHHDEEPQEAAPNSDEREERAMIYAMQEVMLEEEGEEEKHAEIPVPSNEHDEREHEIEENESNTVEEVKIPDVDGSRYSKIEMLRVYLEDKLGSDALVEAYNTCIHEGDSSADDIGYERYHKKLAHLMNWETLLEYLPLILTLIDMESKE
jgi:serine/threonine protein kinase